MVIPSVADGNSRSLASTPQDWTQMSSFEGGVRRCFFGGLTFVSSQFSLVNIVPNPTSEVKSKIRISEELS